MAIIDAMTIIIPKNLNTSPPYLAEWRDQDIPYFLYEPPPLLEPVPFNTKAQRCGCVPWTDEQEEREEH